MDLPHHHTIASFYLSLSDSQVKTILVSFELPMTHERRNSFVGTPTTRSSDTMGWQMLSDAFYRFVGQVYEESSEKGDAYLRSNVEVLAREFPVHLPIDFSNPSKELMAPFVRLLQHIPNTNAMFHLFSSKGINNPFRVLKSCIVQWALYPHLQEKGVELLRDILHHPDTIFSKQLSSQLSQWSTEETKIQTHLVTFLQRLEIPLVQK
jgi:hypothetical protein